MNARSQKLKGNLPFFRRPKQRPRDDFWHTLKIGVPAAIFLFIVLPHLI